MCSCIFVGLAHLGQSLICEIGYSDPLSFVRPSTFSNGFFSETTGPIQAKIHIKPISYGMGERKFIREVSVI